MGKLTDPAWRAAVCAVPRHELVPVYYEYTPDGWRMADTGSPEGRARWLQKVYSNTALFTLPEGRSSSSMPSLMTRMLEALDIRDGHDVLEIGTGSGYNAALLCHRLGDHHVYSVDIESDLVDFARDRLAALGYRPILAARDGAEGLPEFSPFDKIIATCSVPSVPWSWVAQTRVGGLILADVKPGGVAGNLVLLRRYEDRAEGRFDARYGSFMAIRDAGGSPSPPRAAHLERTRSSGEQRTTSLDLPRPWEHPVFWFFAHIHARLHVVRFGQLMDPDTGQPGDAYLAGGDGAWCEIGVHTDDHGHRVVWQAGPRRLWDDLEAAYERWAHLGRPGWKRFGLTVTERQHTVWLDDPHSALSWIVAGAVERPDLADELYRRRDIDQQVRSFAINGRTPTDAEIERARQVDADNAAWLETVVVEHGWPGIRLVGEHGAHSAWLIAQHADRTPERQRHWLTLLQAAVVARDAAPGDLAYLQDRVATSQRVPQRHGTQWLGIDGKNALAPLEDPRRVNEYRVAAGLHPLTDDEIATAFLEYPS